MLPGNLAKRRLASIPCLRRREFHVGCLTRAGPTDVLSRSLEGPRRRSADGVGHGLEK